MTDEALALTVAAVLLLVVLSAFFSGSETALTVASRPLMHQLAQNGNGRARLVNSLRARADELLATILLGNNLVNILSSALATSVLVTLFGDVGVIYATLAVTFLVVVFGEILPKTVAFQRADKVALLVAPVINGVMVVLSPVTRAIDLLLRPAFRGVAGRREVPHLGPSSEELRGAIELHAEEGAVVRDERVMLHSVLDLGEVTVEEVMVHRRNVTMIDAD